MYRILLLVAEITVIVNIYTDELKGVIYGISQHTIIPRSRKK